MYHHKSINVIFGRNMTFGKLLSLKQPMKKWPYLQSKKDKQMQKRCLEKRI